VTEHRIPRERDLPVGRIAEMKDDLMAHIESEERQDQTERRVVAPAARPRRRRAGLTAAAVVVGLVITGAAALRGGDSASAGPNFAARTEDGFVRIHIEDLDDPEQVEQDLADVGVTAVVDIHEGGGRRCDDARSDGWTESAPGLFPSDLEDVPGNDMFDFALDPDALRPGERLAVELFWDEHDGDWATMTSFRTSLSPIGECDLIEDDAVVVDAENAIVGG
jgi:hypothetical protein